MTLDLDNVVPFLIERGLVDLPAVVDEGLRIVDASRRNRNLKVLRRSGEGVILKQPHEAEPRGAETFAREAAIYRFFWRDPRGAPMRAVVPRLLGDGDGGSIAAGGSPPTTVLTLELVARAVSFGERLGRDGADRPGGPCDRLGRALAALHGLPPDDPAFAWPHRRPWALDLHRPTPDALDRISGANLLLVKIVQRDVVLAAGLDRLRAEWSPRAIVHGDAKGDNVLVVDPAGEDGSADVRICDWELADVGDPCWDVGTVLAELLLAWVRSMPLRAAADPEQAIEGAATPLERVKPGARRFWEGYAEASRGGPAACPVPLLHAVRYAAARLLQAAFEASQDDPSLSSFAVVATQLAANVMADPAAAAHLLLGLDPVTVATPPPDRRESPSPP